MLHHRLMPSLPEAQVVFSPAPILDTRSQRSRGRRDGLAGRHHHSWREAHDREQVSLKVWVIDAAASLGEGEGSASARLTLLLLITKRE
jgi:hypothetical protein